MSIESLKFLILLIVLNGIAIGIAFICGQATYQNLGTGAASIAGHIYGIITSAIAFFFFARYLKEKKSAIYLRKFFFLYLIVYLVIVILIIIPLLSNLHYLYSTIGNALILYSLFILICFLFNPEILGISGNIKKIFQRGKHVRVIIVYLLIILLQLFGFSLLNWAIHLEAGNSAFIFVGGGGENWADFIYYSVITLTTIGYGDIFPLTGAAKFSIIIQAIISHIITVLFLAILFVYISSSIGESVEHNDEKPIQTNS
ncbi:MAG: potassium channel family protein [Candidatus Helarchaeota archaeon]